MTTLLALVLVLAGCAQQPAPEPAPRPPNLLVILADDLDPDHPGFAGNPAARTPSLDALAARGAYFPVLLVQPVCRAAHATLLAGRFPHETGIRNNRTAGALAPEALLPWRLQARGYATFCAGKLWEGEPAACGFDAAVTERSFARGGPEAQAELFRFLEERPAGEPWFVWWAPNLPHVPHEPPARLLAEFRDAPVAPPPGFAGDVAAFAQAERACLAMEAWLDEAVGALLAKLDELGQRDQTLVLFLADNGWATASPSKGTPREKGVRSPLVVVPPGAEPRARRLDALVSLVDVHATLLDYAGAPHEGRGTSLRPLLEERPFTPRERLFGAVFRRGGADGVDSKLVALHVRDARWKLVTYVRHADSAVLSADASLAPPFRRLAGTVELFDLDADPLELTDLSADPAQAERVQTLRAAALEWWRTTGGDPAELETRDGF